MKNRGLLLGIALLLAVLLAAAPAAALVAWEITPNIYEYSGDFSLGLEFTVNNTVKVTHLGFYDSGGDGLAASHAVGIFAPNQSLLVSGTVLASTSSPLTGNFRWVDVPLNQQVTLSPGNNYRIAAVTGANDDLFAFWADATFDPSVNYIMDRFKTGATSLVWPDTTSVDVDPYIDAKYAWIGPNFQANAVPVPPSLVLLGSGLLGLLGLGYYRKQS
jgi:hypothetical protein